MVILAIPEVLAVWISEFVVKFWHCGNPTGHVGRDPADVITELTIYGHRNNVRIRTNNSTLPWELPKPMSLKSIQNETTYIWRICYYCSLPCAEVARDVLIDQSPSWY